MQDQNELSIPTNTTNFLLSDRLTNLRNLSSKQFRYSTFQGINH